MKLNVITNPQSQIVATGLLVIITLLALPSSASALSCLNPAEMLEKYATDESYTVALIEAGATETEGDQHNQVITTKEVYKGKLAPTDTVNFTFHETWNYLCSGGPAEEGTQSMYIIRDQQVVQSFAADSELGQNLIQLITESEQSPVTVSKEEMEKKSLMQQIVSLLKQIISLFSGDIDEVVTDPDKDAPQDYIGLTVADAEHLAITNDVLFRVVAIDSIPQEVTDDLREGRINAVVEDGKVISYTVEKVETEKDKVTHDAIIGLTVKEAEAYAQANNTPFRIGKLDDEYLPLTMDYRPGRITATVTNNVVTAYTTE